MPDGIKRTDFKTGKELGAGERPTRISFGMRRRFGRMAPLTAEQPVPESPYPMAIPQTWGEPVGWDQPITFQSETGEKMEALLKPDRTVWRGGEQIGSVDEQGGFIPSPPTAWEQFGEAGKQIGMWGVQGLGYLFKPFEMYHEYVGVPFAMALTVPGWGKEKPLEAESVGDFFKQWFSKEGEFRQAYHEWNAPKYLRGTLELIPWFFLPAVGQVGRAGLAARGIAGKVGKLAPQLGKAIEYSPYGLMEKAAGKIVQYPIKVGGKVVRRLTVTRDITLPEPAVVEDLLAAVAKEHPERLRAFRGRGALTTAQQEKLKLAREAETTFKKVEVLRNEDRLLKESAVPSTMSLLASKGDEATLFRLKDVAIPDTKLTHELVTAPWIKPRAPGASMALDDILANPSKYEWSGIKGKQARLWAEQYYEIQSSLTRFWDTYIQRPIGKKPGEQYVHSVVTAQKDLKTGATILEKQLYPAGTRGGISGAAKPLKFRSQGEGIKGGYKYARPSQALAMQMEEYYNMTTFKRAMSLIDDLFQDPMERMNKEIAETMRKYISDIKFLGGGITRVTTAEGKVIIEKHPGLKALIQSVRRGEVPTAGMIKAVERRFPELGVGLRDALEIRYLEFDQALKGISEAVFKDTKITRDKFREMLTVVRSKRVAKPPPHAEEMSRAQAELAGLEESLALDPVALERFTVGGKQVDLTHFISLREGTFPEYFTIKEARALFPKHEFVTGLVKGKVPRDVALDNLTKRLGMSADEIAERAMQIRAERTRIKQLGSEVAAAGPLARDVQAAGAGRNVEAGELTETLDALGVEAGKQVRFLSKLYQSAYKETTVEREAALKQLLKSTESQITRLKAESKAFAPQFRLAREQAIKTAYSEGRIIGLAGYVNKIIPDKTEWGMTGREISDRLMKILTPDKVNAALTAAARMSRMGVTVTAAMDLSLIFIQGCTVMGHDVARWATFKRSDAFFNMTKELVKGIWNPKYQDEFMAKNFALLKEMGENRAVVQKAVEYMRPEDLVHFAKKIPLVGGWAGAAFKHSYGRFGAGFGSGSLAARTTMYKQMREAWLREGHSLPELGELVNKLTGVVSSAELGVSATRRAVESAGLFAPNYTRAYLMLIRDLFRGTKTAGEVRKAMAGMLAGGTIGYVGLSEMLGQEPKLNPAPKSLGGDGAEFMSFKIDSSVIGIPGFWYSAIRMMAWVNAAAEERPEDLISLDWRENPTLKFLMGRTSPLVALGREIIEQKDFLGRNLDQPDDWLRTVGAHFVTIASQNIVLARPDEQEGKYKRFGAEIFGLRTFPRGDWSKLDDMKNEYAQREFQKPFDDLNREQRDKLLETYPEYKALSEDAREKMVWESGEDFEQWTLASEQMADVEYHAIGEQMARSLFAGMIDYRTYLDEESTLRKIYQGRAKERRFIESMADPEQAERWAKWAEERPPEDQALDEYWEIRSNLKRTPTGQIDWDEMERRVKAYLAPLDSDTRSYILRMKDRRLRNLPPMMQKIAQVQAEGREVVDEYYDQPEGKERVKYRRIYPTVDAWLLIMGRVSVPRTEAAMQLAMEMLQQRGLPPTLIAALAEGAMPPGATPVTTATRFARRPIRGKWK